MWILGLILVLIAVGLGTGAVFQQRKLGDLLMTQVVEVSFLDDLAASLVKDTGKPGSMVYYTGVKGQVRSEAPLISELGEVPCVYYRATVAREYEETYYETRNGRQERKTRRSSETVSHNERSIAFTLEDATGQLRVEPEKAKKITQSSVSRFEPARQGQGGFSIQVGGIHLNLGGGSNTVGYRFTEEVIPVDTEVFIMGEVTDREGTLQVGKPKDKRRFLVSVKDEETLIDKAQSSAKGLRIAALIVGGIGLALMAFGLLT